MRKVRRKNRRRQGHGQTGRQTGREEDSGKRQVVITRLGREVPRKAHKREERLLKKKVRQ